MKRVGKPWSEHAAARRCELHSRSDEIKRWRENEHAAGRPSSLEDYFRAHGLCFVCEATGMDPRPVGWDGDVALFLECKRCAGTGKFTG